jgi:hypothetical protein
MLTYQKDAATIEDARQVQHASKLVCGNVRLEDASVCDETCMWKMQASVSVETCAWKMQENVNRGRCKQTCVRKEQANVKVHVEHVCGKMQANVNVMCG